MTRLRCEMANLCLILPDNNTLHYTKIPPKRGRCGEPADVSRLAVMTHKMTSQRLRCLNGKSSRMVLLIHSFLVPLGKTGD